MMRTMRSLLRLGDRTRQGFTLPELLVAMGIMSVLAYGISTIYFSTLFLYNDQIWQLPPYDAATAAVKRATQELMGAMLIDTHTATSIEVIMPLKDANHDNVLTLGAQGYQLNQGDRVTYYLSDATGSLAATGYCLWKAVKPQGAVAFTPRVKIADNIHPELNPVDPTTGLPYQMFRYWPDDVRLWGVEIWMTSTTSVHGQTKVRTAHSEVYLRNL